MRRPRRNYSDAFKASVALEALKGEKIWPKWPRRTMRTQPDHDLEERVTEPSRADLGNGGSAAPESQEQIRKLHEKIGELTVERDFLELVLGRFRGASAKR